MISPLTAYIGIPAAMVAMLTIVGYLRELYGRTLGGRRNLRAAILKLGSSLTIGYVDELLGRPIAQWSADKDTYYTYRSPDSWVVVVEASGSGAVDAFAITARTSKLGIRTDTFTNEQIKVVLGQTMFVDVPVAGTPTLRMGARRFTYHETSYFGNPGRYDHYILAYNDAGFGSPPDTTGRDRYIHSRLSPEDFQRLREGFIVNTIAVVAGGDRLIDPEILIDGFSVGVNLDRVRRLPE